MRARFLARPRRTRRATRTPRPPRRNRGAKDNKIQNNADCQARPERTIRLRPSRAGAAGRAGSGRIPNNQVAGRQGQAQPGPRSNQGEGHQDQPARATWAMIRATRGRIDLRSGSTGGHKGQGTNGHGNGKESASKPATSHVGHDKTGESHSSSRVAPSAAAGKDGGHPDPTDTCSTPTVHPADAHPENAHPADTNREDTHREDIHHTNAYGNDSYGDSASASGDSPQDTDDDPHGDGDDDASRRGIVACCAGLSAHPRPPRHEACNSGCVLAGCGRARGGGDSSHARARYSGWACTGGGAWPVHAWPAVADRDDDHPDRRRRTHCRCGFSSASCSRLRSALAVRSRLAALRARRLEHQRGELLEDVGLLQAALLPEPPVRLGPVGTSVAYRPADGPGAGGDFYDVFALEDGHWRSSSAMSPDTDGRRCRIRRSCASRCGHTLRPAFRRAAPCKRRELCSSASSEGRSPPSQRPPITHASASWSTLAPVIRHRSCSARSRSRRSFRSPSASSPPIGAGMRTGARQTVVSVPGRSQVCFHTDGVTEARVAGELFGAERLARALAELGSRATASALLERVAEETDSRPDDMAVCLLGIEGGAACAGCARRGARARS